MKRALRFAMVAGICALNGLVACGDDGEGSGDAAAGRPSFGGASKGGNPGTGGVLSAGTSPVGGHGGTNPGAGAPGQAGSGEDASGGTSSAAGTDGGVEEGGMASSMAGTTNTAGDGSGGLGGSGGSAGMGTAGGDGGEPLGGTGGAASTECGDGVLSSGEECCTPDWVDTRIETAVDTWTTSAVGNPQCLPRQGATGFAVCDTARCPAAGEIGCGVEVTSSTAEYLPATERVRGSMNVAVTGHVQTVVGACNFVAHFDDLAYEADVIRTVTPETLTLGIGTPEVDPQPRFVWENCPSSSILEQVLTPILKERITPTIQALLVRTLRTEEACPY